MKRPTSWPVVATFVVIMLETVGALVLSTLSGQGPGSDATAYATVLFVLATSAVGTLIGLRRPGNTIGWLLRVAAFGFATGSFLVIYVEVAVAQAGSLPVGPIAVWLGDLMFQLAFGVSATFLLLLFPTGRLPSPRWKLVGWMAGLGMALMFAAVLLGPGAFEDLPIENPLALEETSPILRVFESVFYLMLVPILASVASLIVRYRQSAGEERQQLKWVAVGVVVLAIGVAGTVVWDGLSDDTVNLVIALALTAVPISIGMAILRYRLYDIDRIISRTVSYGAVTALLVGTYVAFVFVLGDLLPSRENSLVVAASTLAVAGLFNPLRRRVQDFVDRRFNRSRYDLSRTIEAFSQRLRTEVDLDQLGRDLQDVAADSMHPKSISLWLRDDPAARIRPPLPGA
jgi:hypothetical protein